MKMGCQFQRSQENESCALQFGPYQIFGLYQIFGPYQIFDPYQIFGPYQIFVFICALSGGAPTLMENFYPTSHSNQSPEHHT